MNAAVENLRTQVRGRVLLPSDDGFAQARSPWNRAVEQPVAAVVEAADADDAAAVVRHARAAGLTVAAQPNGHGASGNTAGVVLLRTGALDGLAVDPAARTARAEAGVTWGRVQAEAGPHGLTGMAGSSPIVSVVGYTLGGGLSWFGRSHGWAADSVTAFEVVDAEGERGRVTAASDPDLFWALRGGGGDFALVTAVEFDLHPAPELYGGRMLFPGALAARAFDAFRAITEKAPDALSTWYTRLHPPGGDPLVAVDVAFLGGEAEAKELLRPLEAVGAAIADTRRPMSPAELGAITADPTDPGPGFSRARSLADLDGDAGAVLAEEDAAPLLMVQVRHLGGALARPSDSATGALAAPYLVYTLGLPLSADLAAGLRERCARLWESLGGRVGGRRPYSLLAPGESAADAFTPEAVARLREVKRARDPHGVFRANFPVLD
ncbi:FAD-binding oxidoreductase [Streptomonospora nanhaiensis]|uniref:FAD/FMN-containing dehydrogenase n=1 Tax=Streptomonospora nanhaiensis TaxID=1323731 RepID=A0A853BJK6_9ACTN|nr:FAD-binding oxidoreductase [Streptomonospora nanhaiensis]MBX9390789.1 FAD-binding oxidoreductase [Streptomonospora nanhaiensis]NYI94696.1 FAD/FMN-containing dehydrogenase [Streptomonospora nanhaiensis]